MSRRLLFSLLLILVLPAATAAERYRVDLIVFIDLRAGSDPGLPARLPPLDGALGTDNAAALIGAGIRLLPDDAFGLQREWSQLRSSRNFRPLFRLAWEQTDPPARGGPRLAVQSGESVSITTPDSLLPLTLSPLAGSVALRRSRFLHLDVDLRYTESAGGGSARQFLLREQRRMRRDELHYLDGPRLRALARVQRVEDGAALP